MDVFEAIHLRRSIRRFEKKPVPDELIQKVIAAGMAAPSAGNQQPWEFIVLSDERLLKQIPQINPHASMAQTVPAAILVCANVSRELHPGFWVIDCSAATENMLLAAHASGLGAVWTGIYPVDERVAGFKRLLGLPQHIIPHSLIVLGYPAEHPSPQDRFKPERIHTNAW